MEERMQRPRAHAHPEASPTRVVVFDAEHESRAYLSDALRLLGLSVLEAKTPLEAIYALSRGSKDVCVAFIGGCLAATTPSEFVSFALEEFPSLRLVTAGADVSVDGERVHRLGPDDDDPAALSALLARLLPELTPQAA